MHLSIIVLWLSLIVFVNTIRIDDDNEKLSKVWEDRIQNVVLEAVFSFIFEMGKQKSAAFGCVQKHQKFGRLQRAFHSQILMIVFLRRLVVNEA